MSQLVFLVPLFPLLGFLINGLLRKQLSKPATGFIGSGVYTGIVCCKCDIIPGR